MSLRITQATQWTREKIPVLFPLDPEWSIMDQEFKEIGGFYEA
jgi:hypothetical protein